jgi:NAD(P)-dependent dehydrogenase (short-subunit alcohol dehydrogenase family)
MAERQPRLAGKVAIVTGAGSRGPGTGNGKATAILFAREGAKVLLVDKFAERSQETQQIIQADGGESTTFEADLIEENQARHMVECAIERYGRLDILHNKVYIKVLIIDATEQPSCNVLRLQVC